MAQDPQNTPEPTSTDTTDTADTTDTGAKPKRDEREVEWAFDFANLGESIRNLLSSLAGDEDVQFSEFEVARAAAEVAEIDIDFSVGEAFIAALPAESDLLMSAELRHIGEIELVDEGETQRYITLKQRVKASKAGRSIQQGLRALADRQNLRWDVMLSPAVPLVLDVDGGVGPSELDLSGLQLRSLNADTGVGELTLTLPVQSDMFEATLDGGVGRTRIYIPDGTAAMLDIDGGVGAVEITVPPGAAVQLKAKGGLGSVSVPASMQAKGKPKDFGMSGTWQTDGYDLAEQHIVIRYDGGVGQLTIREAELI
jgi:hypothetical protein